MSVNLNGDLSQWTLGTSFAACADKAMVADCWRYHKSLTGVVTVAQSTDVPEFGRCGRVIPYSMEVTVTTADTSIASTEYGALVYRGEGSELADLILAGVSWSLWIKTDVPGTYNVGIANGPETYYFARPITISDANVWDQYGFTVNDLPGTLGTDWWTDYRVGYSFFICLASGSSLQEDAGGWKTTTPGTMKWGNNQQTNFYATSGKKLKIAGLRVQAGNDLRMGAFQPPEVTDQACQRYLQKSFDPAQAPASGLGWGNGETLWRAIIAGAQGQSTMVRLGIPMRKTPALTFYNPVAAGSQARCKTAGDCTGTVVDTKTPYSFRINAQGVAGTVANEEIGVHWLADATLPALNSGVFS